MEEQKQNKEETASFPKRHMHSLSTVFLVRTLIPASMSFFVLFVCAYKIIFVTDPQELRAVYWSTITTILGSWMPAPGTKAIEDPDDRRK